MRTSTLVAAISLSLAPFVDAGCDANHTTINSADDLDKIESCTDIDGSLSLACSADLGRLTTLSGDLGVSPSQTTTTVSAPQLEQVQGSIAISNADAAGAVHNLTLSLPGLQYVGADYVVTGNVSALALSHSDYVHVQGRFRVADTRVETLAVAGLGNVNGHFEVAGNAKLQELAVDDLATTEADFAMTDHETLANASFAKLKAVGGDVVLTKNAQLTRFECPALQSAATITWSANGDKAQVSFPKLATLGRQNTTSTSSFEALSVIQLPALRHVQGSLAFKSTSVTTLVVPLAKAINGSVTVKDNPSLTDLALPRATFVDEIWVSENDALTNVTANALTTAGTISLKGAFTNVEFFGLEKVTGDFRVAGDADMDCWWFDEHVKGIVEGEYSCVGSHKKPATAPRASTGGVEDTEGNAADYTTPLDAASSNPNTVLTADSSVAVESKQPSGLTPGAKAGIGIGVSLGCILVLGAGYLLWRKRRRGATANPPTPSPHPPHSGSNDSGSNSDLGVYDGKTALGVQTTVQAGHPHDETGEPAPRLGTLELPRGAFLDRNDPSGQETWKTIRRVSESTGVSTVTTNA